MTRAAGATWNPDQPDPAFTARYPNSRQCSAHSKQTGNRCQQPAIPGATICRYHGAGPQVRRAAQLRLVQLIDPAIAVLAREMATAEKSADRQRAANSILDRAGVPRAPAAPDAEFARSALVERLLAMRAARIEETTAEGNEAIDPEVVRQGQVATRPEGDVDGMSDPMRS